jgi:hypothetical protein
MLDQLLPRRVDNSYRGYRLALWIFAALLLLRSVISVNSLFNGYTVASTADGIPLDTFPPAAAQTVLSLWALLSLSNLVMCVVCALALLRYRGMVPLLFLVLLLQQLGRNLVVHFLPIPRTGAPPASAINLVFLVMMIAGLALSLLPRRDLPPEA